MGLLKIERSTDDARAEIFNNAYTENDQSEANAAVFLDLKKKLLILSIIIYFFKLEKLGIRGVA